MAGEFKADLKTQTNYQSKICGPAGGTEYAEYAEGGEYVAMRLHKGQTLSTKAARLLVGYLLRCRSRATWTVMKIDQFSAGGETLLLARPFQGIEVRLADYSLPFLHKYLTK